MANSRERVAIVMGGTRGIGRASSIGSRGKDTPSSSPAATRRSPRSGGASRGRPQRGRRGGRAKGRRQGVSSSAPIRVWPARRARNNAGIGEFGRVDEISPDDFATSSRRTSSGSLRGPPCGAADEGSGGGFIVNIASLASINAFAGGAAYNASKFGLLGLSDAAMLDLRHDGIRVAVVMPGPSRPSSANRTAGGERLDAPPTTSPRPSRTFCGFRSGRSLPGSSCARAGRPANSPRTRCSVS